MTDRELLEMAAKAAGITCDGKGPFTSVDRYDLYNGLHTVDLPWNPLTDDGDALRLAVKLRIDLSLWLYKNSAEAKTHIGAGRGISLTSDNPRPINSHREGNGNDPYAATRRAIVRAAAEIGKAMP